MPLTDVQIRNAPLKAKAYKLSDGGGLHLYVKPGGSKLWRLKYRHLGREKLLSFGAYPETSLKQARKARDEAREQIALGLDPSEERRHAKDAALRKQAHSFTALAQSYLEKQEREGRAPTTLSKNRWLLEMAKADLGALPVDEIKAPNILAVLRKVEARGTYETAHRLRSIIGTVMRFGMAQGIIDADPTPALKGALVSRKAQPRAAVTNKAEFGRLLLAIDAFQGQATTRIALQLLALLYPRPGELRLAQWNEFDLDGAVWTLPAARMKMRRPHRVPLPAPAVALLRQLREITGYGALAFPSIRSSKRPMSDNTLNAALRRMGYASDEATAHGFRASFSTFANEAGLWNPDAIERALAHVESNDVRRAYARGEHWDERLRMADWWSNFLDEARATANKKNE